MESLAPNIFVKNINQTIDFYRLLGFELITTVPEEGDYVWAMMTCGTVTFMFQVYGRPDDPLPPIPGHEGGSLLFYIQTKGIRKLHDRIKDKVNIVKGLEKTFYGATEFAIKDINGYILTFAEDE